MRFIGAVILASGRVRAGWKAPFLWVPVLLFCSGALGESASKDARGGIQTAVSFRNEVMAVLSKAGCNAGTCHGNKNGKGGFKLSLRGQDPELDYVALTHDLFARRLDPLAPEQSLILLKPTTQIAHEGGLRLKQGSEDYEILRRWLAAGMPNDLALAPKLERIEVEPPERVLIEPASELQLHVRAKFSDGSFRDITSLAVYEPANGPVKVSHDGLVQAQSEGVSTILVRYLQCQEPVRLAFVPARAGFVWQEPPAHNYIDREVFTRLRTLRMNPSDLCPDDVFMRRAYLDLLGILPTVEEARAFVNDASSGSEDGFEKTRAPSPRRSNRGPSGTSKYSLAAGRQEDVRGQLEKRRPEKRARLIDRLLERPEFADFWSLKWADLLRAEAHSLDQKGVQDFHHWIRQCVVENKPLDQFARELITARGSTYSSPAANYYRPNRDPLTRARAAAQVFLGTRLQCAECHNHPFDRWTQDDYYDWAGLFARVSYKVIENRREISSDEHEWNGEQIVFLARAGSIKNPRTGKNAQPRFLGATNSPGFYATPATIEARKAREPGPNPSQGGEQERAQAAGIPLPGGTSGSGPDDLEALADWLTSPANTLFARVQANRIWFYLMGRGLVDPPDDFRATNPASHPALLDALAEDLVKHRFDARHLIRLIMNSRTYQLSSEPNETNESDEMNFSHALVRRLGAEQLLDCQSEVAGVPLKFAGYPVGLRAAQLAGVRPESKGRRRANHLDQFLEIFGKPPRLLTTDTERTCECNMGQAFQMISGPMVNELLAEKENRVSRLLAAGRTNREIIEELFWAALTRSPTPQEAGTLLAGLDAAQDRRAELEDILWGLLNSKDFLFRK